MQISNCIDNEVSGLLPGTSFLLPEVKIGFGRRLPVHSAAAAGAGGE